MFVDSAKMKVEGQRRSSEAMTRRKNVLGRRDNPIEDTADPYINPLAHLESFSLLIRHRAVYIKGYGSRETQIIAANV